MMRRQRNAAPLVALLIFEMAAIAIWQIIGSSSSMQVPWHDLSTWLSTASIDQVFAPVLRIVAQIVAIWLFVSTALFATAQFTRAPGAMKAASRFTLPSVRRVVDGAMAMSIATTSIVGFTSTAAMAADGASDKATTITVGDGKFSEYDQVIDDENSVGTPGFDNGEGESNAEPTPTTPTTEATTSTTAVPATPTETTPSTTPDTVPSTTSPSTTVPSTTAPSTTVPSTTTPSTTAPSTTEPAPSTPTTPDTTTPTTVPETPPTSTAPNGNDDPASSLDGSVSIPNAATDSVATPRASGIPAEETTTVPPTTVAPAPEAPVAEEPAPAPEPAPAENTQVLGVQDHKVVAGENLWSISRDALAQSSGRAAADVPENEIREYWLKVIDENKDTLRSKDPHWIFPGEVVKLPAINNVAK